MKTAGHISNTTKPAEETTMATTTPINIQALRSEYADALRGLCYDNADASDIRARVEAAMPTDKTPAAYVKTIKALRVECRRCLGSGIFTTWTENGKPRGPGGHCFRCNGTGTQTHEDGHRNRAADMAHFAREAAAMFR